MRAASEILVSGIGMFPAARMDNDQRDAILRTINEARKETIIECADLLNPENSERMKEEMLSLIKKLR